MPPISEHQKTLLGQFDPEIELHSAFTAPASWYADKVFLPLESAVLKKTWQIVGAIAQLQKTGSYFSGDFLGEPYFVIKSGDGELKAFFNVCRHHAACLLSDKGAVEHIACPYHGWTYSLTGELQKAPHLGPVKSFNKKEMGLVPIPLKVVGPFVLLNFANGDDSSLEEWSELFARLQATGYEKLNYYGRREYLLSCNWKVYVDNYLDGGYHVNILHRGLAGQLDLEGYKIENFKKWTLQSCEGNKEAPRSNGDFSERIGTGALYAWMFPNYMINRYGNIMDTNWVIPIGHDKCKVVFDYYFSSDCDSKFIEASLEASDRVQQEDIMICESVQRGLSSSAYHAGRYAASESGMHLFHRWLHREIMR